MAKIQLSISPKYVSDWGIWEALRELFQNAADAHDEGYPMSYAYYPKSQVLQISNEGATISRQHLLLGESEKRSSSARGKFGEGFKLAWVVLLRMGKKVKCKCGTESWHPNMERSDDFGGCEVIVIQTKKTASFSGVETTIEGISKEDWEAFASRMLFIGESFSGEGVTVKGTMSDASGERVETTKGSILLDPKYKGMVFTGGIYVCRMKEEYEYGYDLKNLTLDRDRKFASSFDVNWEIRLVMCEAFQNESIKSKQVYALMKKKCGEADALSDYSDRVDSTLRGELVECFQEEFGENAIPVESMGESANASQFGVSGVVGSKHMVNIFIAEKKDLEHVRMEKSSGPKLTYSWNDLEDDEKVALKTCVDSVAKYSPEWFSLDAVTVADFYEDGILGIYADRHVSVARSSLKDPSELIATLIHEIAHDRGADGSSAHRNAIESLAGKIVFGLMNEAGHFA